MSALSTLRSIDTGLNKTQLEISSGYRVNSAANNAAYWSISRTMRSDDKAMSAVQDTLALGAGMVDVTYNGMTAALSVVDEIKSKLVIAREPGVDRTKINAEITELRNQIYSIVDSSTFGGQNWLHRNDAADDTDKEIVGSFVRSPTGNVSIQTIRYSMQAPLGTKHLIDESYHNGILTNVEFARRLGTSTEWVLMNGRNHNIHPTIAVDNTTSPDDIDDMIKVVDYMIQYMADAASDLGALSSRISLQTSFASTLRATIQQGIGRLVDADMNEASTRLKALQVQQQLGDQSLSIANAQSDRIMQLFK